MLRAVRPMPSDAAFAPMRVSDAACADASARSVCPWATSNSLCARLCASFEYGISCDVWLRVAVFISACVARMLYPIKLYTYTYEWLGRIDPLILSK